MDICLYVYLYTIEYLVPTEVSIASEPQRLLVVAMWILGIEPGSCGIRVSDLNG